MKKIYIGSSKLKCHFKMFRVRYSRPSQAQLIKQGVMGLMNGYLQKYDGKLINVKELTSANELLVYFVTGEEEPHSNWQQFLKNVLLKGYNIEPGSVEIGPRVG